MYKVYKHTSPNGKVYIGITAQAVTERWRKGKGYLHCPHFNKAIEKYGWDNFKHEILYTGLTKSQAEEKEVELIEVYQSTNPRFGYNCDSGGNVNRCHNEETKRKISEKHKGKIVSPETRAKMSRNHADFRGERSPLYGKALTAEHRRKLSEAHIGKRIGEDNPMFGKKHSDHAKLLQSNNRKGKCVGKNNHKSKQIEQYTMNGSLIKTFDCILDAERYLGLPRGGGGHISSCAKGKLKSAYGFVWRYMERGKLNEVV
jgi:group I intron endonuclease